MNSLIETMNQWGGNFLAFARPMLWQSSLLIATLFVLELLFRRKLRASLRYALWLVVLVKLCVPPTLALPTSPAWWLHKAPPPVVAKPTPHYTVTYDNDPPPQKPQIPLPALVPSKAVMTNAAWLLAISAISSLALLLWLLMRWWQITRLVNGAATSGRLTSISDAAQKFIGMRFKVQVKLTRNSMSPAVCGLFRPAILIPQSLAENFSDEQLRAVLLHELIHLRRRDVWVNFVQALLQIIYWWHPLVWLANAHIRRVREEAVDDAVMLTLRDDAESYATTLLEVAKLALNRPLASLGLVGIMESRHALRQRIERLVNFRPPRRAGLTLVSLLGILAFTAVAVPMGDGPAGVTNLSNHVASQIHIKARFMEVPKESLALLRPFPELTNGVTILDAASFEKVLQGVEKNPGSMTLAEPEVVTTSGRQTQMRATLTQTIITNYTFQDAGTNSSISPQTSQIETGPVLDEVATVLADGYTIDLKTKASLMLFLGYANTTNTTAVYNSKGEEIDLPQVLPKFRKQQTDAHTQLRDGQTVVLGKFDSHSAVGAFPPGGLFVGNKPDVIEKHLLVFITATIVDPAGNRIHPDN